MLEHAARATGWLLAFGGMVGERRTANVPCRTFCCPVLGAGAVQDPKTGLWWQCGTFYSAVSCPKCSGMLVRCQSDLRFAFRSAGHTGFRVGTGAAAWGVLDADVD